jgi:peroxiredoxin Q/BCP
MNKIIITFISILMISCGGTADKLSVGDLAPDFTLEDFQGNSYTLSQYRGESPVIIYFYPKANTSGCTTQACGIRDDYINFKESGVAVLGISVDSKDDIKEFVESNNLNFPLLSDLSKETAENYAVLNNVGLANRITFIVDKEGKIAHIIRNVDVDTHSAEVLELASKL